MNAEKERFASFDLTDKVAIVTGGSRGLGRAIAGGLAAAGADVVVASRRLESCQDAAQEIASEFGVRTLAISCHVGKWSDLQELADFAWDFGGVDILVNNAGISPVTPPMQDVTEELWDKIQDVNVKSVFRLTSLLGPRMIDRGGGTVINVSSAGAIKPLPLQMPYAGPKAGVNSLTRSFAHALGPTVRVNAVAAGPFRTDMATTFDLPEVAAELEAIPLPGAGEPNEIVGAVQYRASDASTYTTGAILEVHGGFW